MICSCTIFSFINMLNIRQQIKNFNEDNISRRSKIDVKLDTFCISVSACIFPTIFKQSSWIDNIKGEVTFTSWELKGWQYTVGTYNISNWEIVDNTQFDSQSTTGEHGYLALRYPSLLCSLDKEVYFKGN